RATARARIESIDSCRAASTNAHVLTTTTSASLAPDAATSPSASSDATTFSESTAFFGHPSVSTKKRGARARAGLVTWPSYKRPPLPRPAGRPEQPSRTGPKTTSPDSPMSAPRALHPVVRLLELLDGHEPRR